MRKNIFKQSWAQKVVAVGLCAAMTVPSSAAYLGTVTTAVADELPEPVARYEAGYTEDEDTTGTNKPKVVSVDSDELWEGATAWEFTDRADATETPAETADPADPDATEAPATAAPTTITHNDSSISVTNPLIGDTDLVESVDIDEETKLPMWSKGVTITYWVKTNGSENANPSAVVSFKGESVKNYQKDTVQKYRIANAYADKAEEDPSSEFYVRVLKTYTNGNMIVDFYDYDIQKFGLTKGEVTSLGSYFTNTATRKEATPQLICASPTYYHATGTVYVYTGAYDAEGNPTAEKLSSSCITLDNSFFYQSNDLFKSSFVYTDYLTLEGNTYAQYGYTNGMLQLRTDGTMYFNEDVANATRYTVDANGDEVEVTNNARGIQANNSLIVYGKLTDSNNKIDADTPEDDTEWHYVAYVIKNNEVYYYMDGEKYTVVDNFETYAAESFDLGTGLLGDYATDTLENFWQYNANRNGKTIMEWLTADTTTTLNIGGVNMAISYGDKTSDSVYAAYPTVAGTQVACVKVYDEELSEEDVKALYAAKDGDHSDPNKKVTYGDADQDGDIDAVDALEILKHVVGLTKLEGDNATAANVDGKNGINAEDALYVLKYIVELIKKFPIEE